MTDLVVRIFFGLKKLKYLDLSGNPLVKLPAVVFQDVPVCIIYLTNIPLYKEHNLMWIIQLESCWTSIESGDSCNLLLTKAK